jgi:hypothetical protein
MLFMNDKAADWLNDKKGVFERDRAPVAGPTGEIKTEQREVVLLLTSSLICLTMISCAARISRTYSRTSLLHMIMI